MFRPLHGRKSPQEIAHVRSGCHDRRASAQGVEQPVENEKECPADASRSPACTEREPRAVRSAAQCSGVSTRKYVMGERRIRRSVSEQRQACRQERAEERARAERDDDTDGGGARRYGAQSNQRSDRPRQRTSLQCRPHERVAQERQDELSVAADEDLVGSVRQRPGTGPCGKGDSDRAPRTRDQPGPGGPA